MSSRVLWLNLTGVVSGGIGGGAGTAAGVFDQPVAKYTLGGAALLFSLTGIITGYLATWYAATFARECP